MGRKKGIPLSEEHRAKIKEAAARRRGIPRLDETKKKIGDANRGRKRTDDERVRISEGVKRAWAQRTEEERQRICEAMWAGRRKNEQR